MTAKKAANSPSLVCVFCVLCALLALVGCAQPTARSQAIDAAAAYHFTPLLINSPPFLLFALERKGVGDALHVYIEGDGAAYVDAHTPSKDPTPRYPIGLWLALNDPSSNAILYLARPGQYVGDLVRTSARYYTDWRMAPEVITSMNEAINKRVLANNCKRVVLIGFSGGGGICAYLANKRTDVTFLATLGGNLNQRCISQHHNVSYSAASLDAEDILEEIATLPQRHLRGENDAVIPAHCFEMVCQRLRNAANKTSCITIPNLGHSTFPKDAWNYDYTAAD